MLSKQYQDIGELLQYKLNIMEQWDGKLYECLLWDEYQSLLNAIDRAIDSIKGV